jgi:hypothetical protein
MPERPETPGRNKQMQAWGDTFHDLSTPYWQEQVHKPLMEMAHHVAQMRSPQAQEAMVQLGIWANRMPVQIAEEISRAQSPDDIKRAADDERTGTLVARVQYYAPNVPTALADRLRKALSDQAVWENVMAPAAQQAGLG